MLNETTADTLNWPSAQQGSICNFVGLDLAPNDLLETGICVMNRNGEMVRLDKCSKDKEIWHVLGQCGGLSNMLIVIDAPKNLTMVSKFKHEELKYHASTSQPEKAFGLRYAERTLQFYNALKQAGANVFITLHHYNYLRYGITTPFKTRSSQGCKSLQLALRHQLLIRGLPDNIMPLSSLESTLAAHMALLMWQKPSNVSYYHLDNEYPVVLINKGALPLVKPQRRFRGYRRRLGIAPS